MTTIDFYVLPAAEPAARLHYACRLAAKAWRQGLPVFVFAEPSVINALDLQLWDFRADSFLPHRRLEDAELPDSPIELGSTMPPDRHHGLLINLADPVPDWFSRFDRVAEIVCQDTAALQQLREHYRFYRSRGYPLRKHDIPA